MLQIITSSLRTFVCIDALDECAAVHPVELLNLLQQALEESLGAQIFIIGRHHIRAEVGRCLAWRVISASLCSSKGGIIEYLCVRLSEDETPDAIDESLEAEILDKIPAIMSEVCVGNNILYLSYAVH